MKQSRRNKANALNAPVRLPVPPVSRYAIKAMGEAEARAAHAALYGPREKASGGVVNG